MDSNQKQTLLKWRARCKRAQMTHNYTEISYRRFHISIGILLILLTTSASVMTFASFPASGKWVPVVISVAATIFAAFQTFMKFSEQAEIHRVIARRYGELKKEIEYVFDFPPEQSVLSERVDAIRIKENEISQDSPNALTHNWNRAKKETKNENDEFSTRISVASATH